MTVVDDTPVADQATVPGRRAGWMLAYLPILVAAALVALVPLRYHDSRYMMGVITLGVVLASGAYAFSKTNPSLNHRSILGEVARLYPYIPR